MISKTQIYATSFAVAGSLAWMTFLLVAKRKALFWSLMAAFFVSAVIVPDVLMRMRIWNRHAGLKMTKDGKPITHAHTYDEAWGHVH